MIHGEKKSRPKNTWGHEYSQSWPLAVVENRVASMEAEDDSVLLDRCVGCIVSQIYDQCTESLKVIYC